MNAKSASGWTESLEATVPKDSGIHHRAFDGKRSAGPLCLQDRVLDEVWPQPVFE